MRYISGVRGDWTIAKLRTLGALTTPMELQRYDLVDGGGILLGHHGQHEVVKIGEEIVSAVVAIRGVSSYLRRGFPIVALVDLTQRQLQTYDFARKEWSDRDFSLVGLSNTQV